MRKIILLSLSVILVVLVLMSVRFEPMLFYVETPTYSSVEEVERINTAIRQRIVEETTNEIRSHTQVQTRLYNEIECVYVSAPDTSLFFTVQDVEYLDARTAPRVLAGKKVNFIYTRMKYSYIYRVLDKGSGNETSGAAVIELGDDGNSLALEIPGVEVAVSYRTPHSLFIEHPANYATNVIDANTRCDMPLSDLMNLM